MTRRVHIHIDGTVQGVGFRPFVYRVARDLSLGGWVCNSSRGVDVEFEGVDDAVQHGLERLQRDFPPHATITALTTDEKAPRGDREFRIVASDAGGGSTSVLPDLATCNDCRNEIFDAEDRRYRYPFTNCTNCGPRFSIIEAIPYDRAQTTMRGFKMCEACQAEYEDPLDRRFHAQPNACPDCGPRLALRDMSGAVVARRDDALTQAEQAIRDGAVVAIKGLGGFHLMVDATNERGVTRLRRRKGRGAKPFAVMFPSLAALETACRLDEPERAAVTGPRAPIVLLDRLAASSVVEAVAPGNPRLGAMLPYTPLHLLLLADLRGPVVATSANRSDEPICTDGDEAVERLAGIADWVLDHDRPIVRPVEDSVVQVVLGELQVLRYARGFAPRTVARVTTARRPSLQEGGQRIGATPSPASSAMVGAGRQPLGATPSLASSAAIVAAGGHLKSAVALLRDGDIILGPHIGDLDTAEAVDAYDRLFDDLPRLHATTPAAIVHDLHPDYHSTVVARGSGLDTRGVQHHHAHVAAVMAEHGLDGEVLGVSWDGTGYGTDGTVWGGEFLRASRAEFDRVGHLHPFRLPGGDVAAREPRRVALATLVEAFDEVPIGAVPALAEAFGEAEFDVLHAMLTRGVRSPVTTSAGRLFDAVASILGLCQTMSFEAEAAMALQFAAERAGRTVSLRANVDDGILDWRPMLRDLLDALEIGTSCEVLARSFHAALADAIVDIARWTGEMRVVLAGGCFQNRLLLEMTVTRLRHSGFAVYWPQTIPAGDGGLAVGQLAAAASLNPRTPEPPDP